MYSILMPIQPVDATHVRVTCEICGATAEVCGKRERGIGAVPQAVEQFRRVGWHHDPLPQERWCMPPSQVERDGLGRWSCPGCRPKTS